jgi:hypothetical protein
VDAEIPSGDYYGEETCMGDNLKSMAGIFRIVGALAMVGLVVLAYQAGVVHRDYLDTWEGNLLVAVYAAAGVITGLQMFWVATISDAVAVLLERTAPVPQVEPGSGKSFNIPTL